MAISTTQLALSCFATITPVPRERSLCRLLLAEGFSLTASAGVLLVGIDRRHLRRRRARPSDNLGAVLAYCFGLPRGGSRSAQESPRRHGFSMRRLFAAHPARNDPLSSASATARARWLSPPSVSSSAPL